MRLTLGSLCFIVSACLVTTLVQGQIPGTDTTEPKRAIDSNGDFSIAFFRSAYKTRFNRLDTDADGFVSKEEYLFLSRYPRSDQSNISETNPSSNEQSDMDGLPPRIKTLLNIATFEFDAFDQNMDDRLSEEEMMAPIDFLTSRDLNNDGKLDRKELTALYKRKAGTEAGSNSEE